jgi:hypothetical protein
MTDSTQQAAPAHSSARRAAREPHAVSDRADVPIVAAAIPRQTDIATGTLAYSRNSSLSTPTPAEWTASIRSRATGSAFAEDWLQAAQATRRPLRRRTSSSVTVAVERPKGRGCLCPGRGRLARARRRRHRDRFA